MNEQINLKTGETACWAVIDTTGFIAGGTFSRESARNVKNSWNQSTEKYVQQHAPYRIAKVVVAK